MAKDYADRKLAKKRRKKASKSQDGVKKEKKNKIPGKLRGICQRDPFLTKEDLRWRADNEDLLEKLNQKKLQLKGLKRKRETPQKQQEKEEEERNNYKVMVKLPSGCAPESDDETVKVVKPLIGPSSIEVPEFKRFDQRIIRYMQQMRYIEPTEVQNVCWDVYKIQHKNLIICTPLKSGTTTAYLLGMTVLEIKNFGIVTENLGDIDRFLKVGNSIAKFTGHKLVKLGKFDDDSNLQEQKNSKNTENQKIQEVNVGTLHQFLSSPNLSQFQCLIFDNIKNLQSLEFEQKFQQLRQIAPKNLLFWFFVNQSFNFLKVQQFGIKNAIIKKFEEDSPTKVGKWVKQRIIVCADHKKIARLINWFRVIFSPKKKQSNYEEENSKKEIQTDSGKRCVILVKDISTVAVVKKYVEQLNFKVSVLHGKRSQQEKESAVQNFKSSNTPILISTGKAFYSNYQLHSVKVPYLLNFDFPTSMEDYMWRVGLTGPLSSFGQSLSFFTRELAQLATPLIHFLKQCDQPIDDGLKKLSSAFELATKVKQREENNSKNQEDKKNKIQKKRIVLKSKWLRVLRARGLLER